MLPFEHTGRRKMTKPTEETNQSIDTTGGAYVQGNVKTNGNFIGRDQIQHHPIEATVGDIGAGAQVAIGNHNNLQMTTQQSPTKQVELVAIAQLVTELKRQIPLLPLPDEKKVICSHYLEQVSYMFLTEGEAVNEELLRVAKKWLLSNAPQLTDDLTQLFRLTMNERFIAPNT